jgi:hypothetical protein
MTSRLSLTDLPPLTSLLALRTLPPQAQSSGKRRRSISTSTVTSGRRAKHKGRLLQEVWALWVMLRNDQRPGTDCACMPMVMKIRPIMPAPICLQTEKQTQTLAPYCHRPRQWPTPGWSTANPDNGRHQDGSQPRPQTPDPRQWSSPRWPTATDAGIILP